MTDTLPASQEPDSRTPTRTRSSSQLQDRAAQMLSPVVTRTRDVAVLDALADMIDDAQLKKGDRLPSEPTLAARLGVSRSTIREALKSWQTLGILERKKGSGTFLATDITGGSPTVPIGLKLEGHSLLRMLEVRRPLEITVTREATMRATDEDRIRIMSTYRDLDDILKTDEDWRPADALFHRAIYKASQNSLFGQIIEQLHGSFHQVYVQPFDSDQIGVSSMQLHKELCETVITGKADLAVTVIEQILDLVEQDVRETIGV